MWNTTKFLEVNGAKYEVGSAVLHSLNVDIPVFGKLEAININSRPEAFFLLKKLSVTLITYIHLSLPWNI